MFRDVGRGVLISAPDAEPTMFANVWIANLSPSADFAGQR